MINIDTQFDHEYNEHITNDSKRKNDINENELPMSWPKPMKFNLFKSKNEHKKGATKTMTLPIS